MMSILIFRSIPFAMNAYRRCYSFSGPYIVCHKNRAIPSTGCLVKLFQTSSIFSRAKLKNQKRKFVDPVKLKKTKRTGFKFNDGVISIYKGMSVLDIANSLETNPDHIFEVMLHIPNVDAYDVENSKIEDISIIQNIVKKCGHRFKIISTPAIKEVESFTDVTRQSHTNSDKLQHRPPVVTIMGHVDHGKTTLLDKIRSSNIVAGEFGGITQHIGAFSVKISDTDLITFIDTPGHSAFSNMRARGVSVTDIVILIVAADDGVMRTTKESIKLALNMNIPIIVAINKIDKPFVNTELVKKELLSAGLQVEEYGGDVQCIEISALAGTNVDKLLESISILAEILEIKANPIASIEGVVLESHADKAKGPVATVLVQHGCVRKGSILISGTSWCRIRNIMNENNDEVSKVYPGNAVQLTGWKMLPNAGEDVLQVKNEKQANDIIKYRTNIVKDEKISSDSKVIDERRAEHRNQYTRLREEKLASGSKFRNIYRAIREKETVGMKTGPHFPIILRTDVNGSLEAILDVLATYNSSQCRLELVKYGIGVLTNNDIELAKTFNAIIYCFNVTVPPEINAIAQMNEVNLKNHNVIYKLVDDIKAELTDRLEILDVEEITGEAEVLQNFVITHNKKKVPVAGCRCTKGSLKKDFNFRLIRNDSIIFDGKLDSLYHYKSEVESISTDSDCGIRFSSSSLTAEKGDLVHCYNIVPTHQTLDWYLDF